jgi:hypothetical protein
MMPLLCSVDVDGLSPGTARCRAPASGSVSDNRLVRTPPSPARYGTGPQDFRRGTLRRTGRPFMIAGKNESSITRTRAWGQESQGQPGPCGRRALYQLTAQTSGNPATFFEKTSGTCRARRGPHAPASGSVSDNRLARTGELTGPLPEVGVAAHRLVSAQILPGHPTTNNSHRTEPARPAAGGQDQIRYLLIARATPKKSGKEVFSSKYILRDRKAIC